MKGSEIVDLVIVKLEEKSAFLEENGKGGPILSSGDNIDELKPVYSYINAHIAEAANEVLLAAPLNRLIPKNGITFPSGNPQNISSADWDMVINSNNITLPPDFLRLYTLRMKEWTRPVHKAITKTDHLYTLQFNKFTKGTPQKPVVCFSGVRANYDEYGEAMDNILYSTENTVMNTSAATPTVSANIITELSQEFQSKEITCFLSAKDNKWYFVEYDGTGISANPATPATATATEIKSPTLEFFSVKSDYTIDELLYIPYYHNDFEYNRDVAEAIALNCAKKVLEVYSMTDKAAAMNNELNLVLSNMNL